MPSNGLILLPLVAGFLFFKICYFTRYRAQSLEGYRLLLESSLVGMVFLGISRLLVVVVKHCTFGAAAQGVWSEYSSVSYSGTAVGAVIVAVLAAHFCNVPLWECWKRAFMAGRLRTRLKRTGLRLFAIWRSQTRRRIRDNCFFWRPVFWKNAAQRTALKKRIALNCATRRRRNQLLILLNQAAQLKLMIAVTLSSRKFYIGYVKEAPSLDPHDVYFRVYPVRSGYRDEKNLRYEMTTDYDPVQTAKTEDPVFVVIPISDVQAANPFDPVVYAKYFRHKDDTVLV